MDQITKRMKRQINSHLFAAAAAAVAAAALSKQLKVYERVLCSFIRQTENQTNNKNYSTAFDIPFPGHIQWNARFFLS